MQRLQSVLVSNKIEDSEKLMAAKIECLSWDMGRRDDGDTDIGYIGTFMA